MLTFLEVISLIRPFLTRGHPSRGPRLVASAVSFIRLRSATACHCDSHLLGFRIELFDCAPMEIFVGGDYHWVGWGAVIRAEREEIANAARLKFPTQCADNARAIPADQARNTQSIASRGP